MQGVILAAGRGRRLYPVTAGRSKAMAPVAGKPMVARVVDTLRDAGLRRFVFVVGPDDEEIGAFLAAYLPIDRVEIVVQTERRGAAHALSLAVPLIHGPFVLSACDNLTSVGHVQELLETHRRLGANGTLSLMRIDRARSATTGIVDWQADEVRRIVEKPQPHVAPSDISSLPLYVFSTRLLDYLPLVQPSLRGELELQEAVQQMIEHDGGVTGVLTPSRRQLTDVRDLLALNEHFLAAEEPHQVAPDVMIGARSRLVPPLIVESGCMIGAGSVVGPNVVVERAAMIGDDVRVSHAVLLRGSVLPAGASLHHDLVAPPMRQGGEE